MNNESQSLKDAAREHLAVIRGALETWKASDHTVARYPNTSTWPYEHTAARFSARDALDALEHLASGARVFPSQGGEMSEQVEANSAKIAEIRARSERLVASFARHPPRTLPAMAQQHFAEDVLALIEVAEAALALNVVVPDGFDTGPGQDRVNAVFARLSAALEPFKGTT